MTNKRERGMQRQNLAAAFAAARPSNCPGKPLFWLQQRDLARQGSPP